MLTSYLFPYSISAPNLNRHLIKYAGFIRSQIVPLHLFAYKPPAADRYRGRGFFVS